MSTNQQAAQTTTAANVMSGERSFERVEFAITGIRDTDMQSAIWAASRVLGLSDDPRLLQRIFKYLAATCKDQADENDRNAARWQHLGSSPQVTPQQSYPQYSRGTVATGLGEYTSGMAATDGSLLSQLPPNAQSLQDYI
jgi:hypothetical protein